MQNLKQQKLLAIAIIILAIIAAKMDNDVTFLFTAIFLCGPVLFEKESKNK